MLSCYRKIFPVFDRFSVLSFTPFVWRPPGVSCRFPSVYRRFYGPLKVLLCPISRSVCNNKGKVWCLSFSEGILRNYLTPSLTWWLVNSSERHIFRVYPIRLFSHDFQLHLLSSSPILLMCRVCFYTSLGWLGSIDVHQSSLESRPLCPDYRWRILPST